MVYVWLCLSALGAGVMNAVAGGGTLLTFPALSTAVTSLVPANVTSTIALLPGSVASAWGYRKELHACRRWIVLLSIPSVLGGTLGALLITQLDPSIFKFVVPWLILLAALLFLFQPTISRLVRKETGKPKPPPSLPMLSLIVFFQLLVGIYGGYFGAGIGILMLSSLAFLDLADIHEMNALKSWLALCMNGVSAFLFILDGQVVWPYALAMAAAAIAGGYLGARVALKIRPIYVRWLVIAIAFALAGYFFINEG